MSKPDTSDDAASKNELMSQNVAFCGNAPFHDGPEARYLLDTQELSERQKSAAVLLLRGMSDSEVARQINVDRMTVARWRKTPSFRRVLNGQRHMVWQNSVKRLHSLVEPALAILEKQLASDDPKVAMRAASILLRLAGPARVSIDDGEMNPARETQLQERAFHDEVEAYVHAPLPGQPGAP